MNDNHPVDQNATTPEKPAQVFGTGTLKPIPEPLQETSPEGTRELQVQTEVETPPPAKAKRFKLPSLNVSVRARIFLTFMTIAPLVLWIGGINLRALTSVTAAFETVLHESVPQLELLGQIQAESNKLQAEAISYALGGEAEELEEFEETAAKIPVLITQYGSVAEEEGEVEETGYAEELSTALVAINEHASALIALKQRGATVAEMGETLEDLEAAEGDMETIIAQAFADEAEELETEDHAAEQLASTSTTTNIISMGAIFTLALVLGFLAARNVSNPIKQLQETTLRFSKGDRSARSDIQSKDEFGVLATNFNQMAAQLQGTLEGLEDTVQERTKELRERATEMEASQRVAFAASERTTPDDFLNLLVNLILDQFDVYHAQVYLVDDAGENAVLRESTGYAGRQLLQRGHQIPLSDAALVTTCINSGQSVLVSDVTKDPNHLPNPLLPHTQSELVVPLKLEDRVIGALDIQDRVANRFRDDSVVVFETMAEQVAFLFENNELLDQVNRRTQELEKFTTQLRQSATVANQLSAILNPEQLLNEAVVLMQSRFSLYHVHVYLLDQTSQQLTVEAGSGQVGLVLKERGHSIPMDHEHSVVVRAAREVQPTLVVDVSTETDHLPNPLLPDTRAELAVPLVAAGQVIGVLDMQDETPGRFTQADADTFMTLGSQIATSLQTARVFTEQQKTQAALQDSEEQFRVLVENAPEAIVVIDLDTGKFFESNANAEQLYGLSREKLHAVGPTEVSPLVQPDGEPSKDKAMEYMQRALQGETPVFDWMHINADGVEIPCEIRLAHLPAANRKLVRGSVTNISERKEAQEAIIQGDRLKSEFLANMSHELRTPLNSIIGYTDVLLMGLDGELEEEKRLDVLAIQQNSGELLRIINDILDLAKIEAGRMIFELSEVDIKQLLQDVQKSNAGLLVNKPVEVRIEAGDGLPNVTADEGRLTQVLNNLVSNAVKFTEEGSVTIRAAQEGNYVQIAVEDTGVGICEADLEVIFEQFRQADGSIARPEEGTGLGLAITRSLVNLHGGTIHAQSELGKGSTFTVRLPIDNQVSADVVIVDRSKVNDVTKKQKAPALEQPVKQNANGDTPDFNAG